MDRVIWSLGDQFPMNVNEYDPKSPTPRENTWWFWRKDPSPVFVHTVQWNGEQWWVTLNGNPNTLSTFWEACRPAKSPSDVNPLFVEEQNAVKTFSKDFDECVLRLQVIDLVMNLSPEKLAAVFELISE